MNNNEGSLSDGFSTTCAVRPLTRGPGFGTVSADCMNKLEADTRDLCAVREFLEPPISGGNR